MKIQTAICVALKSSLGYNVLLMQNVKIIVKRDVFIVDTFYQCVCQERLQNKRPGRLSAVKK
jgi:hypothetical protein